jgi:hypothetical protein
MRRLGVLLLVILIGLIYVYRTMLWMPGSSHTGPLPPITPEQSALSAALRTHVERVAGEIGHRSMFSPRKLAESAVYIDEELKGAGFEARTYSHSVRGTDCPNIDAELRGTTKPDEIIVIGAHYDAFQGTPGADDNASGVAGVLEIARRIKAAAPGGRARTIRFVLFCNEEPPNFWTPDMGSWVYAKACREKNENIVAMLSLECLGYYDTSPGSQHYPFPLNLAYPSAGDFIGFVGHYRYRDLNRRVIKSFRDSTAFPSEGPRSSRSSRAPAGPTTGRSGRRATRPSWSRTPQRTATPTTTSPATRPRRSTMTAWRGWSRGSRRWSWTWRTTGRIERAGAISLRQRRREKCLLGIQPSKREGGRWAAGRPTASPA